MTNDGGRSPEPALADAELPMLLGYLDRQRATFAWKTGRLDAAGLETPLPPSRMTLGGMLKHLARFENDMSYEWILGQEQVAPWNEIDWESDNDWDWRTATGESPELLYERWREAVRQTRETVSRVTAGEMTPEARTGLHDVLVNMIEEYARHNGHADLIRESIDGLVGHDPPGYRG